MLKSEKKSKLSIVIFYILLTAVAGGSVSTFSKIALKEIPLLSFAFLRFFLAALIILPILIKRGVELNKTKLKTVVLVSLLATINTLFFAIGVRKTTAGMAQTLYAVVPLITGMISYKLLKEQMKLRKILGIAVGFVGVSVIIITPIIGKASPFSGDFMGNIIILIAACSFSLYSVLSKKIQSEFDPLLLTAVFILTTLIIQLIFLPFDFIYHPLWWGSISLKAFFSLLYVGIVGTALYYLTYQHAIKNTTPTIASSILYLQPIFSIILAFFILGEKLTLAFLVGAVLALAGVALVTRSNNQITTVLE